MVKSIHHAIRRLSSFDIKGLDAGFGPQIAAEPTASVQQSLKPNARWLVRAFSGEVDVIPDLIRDRFAVRKRDKSRG